MLLHTVELVKGKGPESGENCNLLRRNTQIQPYFCCNHLSLVKEPKQIPSTKWSHGSFSPKDLSWVLQQHPEAPPLLLCLEAVAIPSLILAAESVPWFLGM